MNGDSPAQTRSVIATHQNIPTVSVSSVRLACARLIELGLSNLAVLACLASSYPCPWACAVQYEYRGAAAATSAAATIFTCVYVPGALLCNGLSKVVL